MSGHSWSLRSLSDGELILRLKAFVSQERESVADVVEHILEMDRRELAVDMGFPSLFAYCSKVLGYSEAESYLRIRAARASARFPRVLSDLREGKLHLDAVARLHPYLTPQNSEALLESASGSTKSEILALVAGFQDQPPVERDIVMPVPAEPAGTSGPPAVGCPARVLPPAEVVAPPRQRFHFTADGELLALVDRLRGLLRHKHPSGRLELIFKEAARALLERLDPQKPPRTPGAKLPGARRRAVAAAVKRQVWARDGGRCAYISPDGRRCESREALEYDHILPWADGGRSDTAGNVRLLCRTHNLRLGRRRFGDRRKPYAGAARLMPGGGQGAALPGGDGGRLCPDTVEPAPTHSCVP